MTNSETKKRSKSSLAFWIIYITVAIVFAGSLFLIGGQLRASFPRPTIPF